MIAKLIGANNDGLMVLLQDHVPRNTQVQEDFLYMIDGERRINL